MAKYLKVEVRDSVNEDNYMKYVVDLTKITGQEPSETNVRELLGSYAKNDSSVSLEDTEWVNDQYGCWELFFSRIAYYDISNCSKEVEDWQYVQDMDFSPDFSCKVEEIYNCSIVYRKPKNVPIKGTFKTTYNEDDDFYYIDFNRI